LPVVCLLRRLLSAMTGPDFKQRLAAILAADVSGYSRLMSLDERATVAALDAARAIFRAQIESRQGRIIDMAGDSVLAVFETATGAVSAALAVQQELDASNTAPDDRRMRFRIGVHLGDVIEKSDGTIYGDGVNIAAYSLEHVRRVMPYRSPATLDRLAGGLRMAGLAHG
jgi:adenylate cyclase